jgi:hypothetical protein
MLSPPSLPATIQPIPAVLPVGSPRNRILTEKMPSKYLDTSGTIDFTHSIASSSDKSVVVVGTFKDMGDTRNAGDLRFYKRKDLAYEEVEHIIGQPNEILGHIVSVCSDGSTAVAAASSTIHIFEQDFRGKWIEIQRIVQKSPLNFVSHLALSNNCTTLAVSEYNLFGRTSKYGKVRVYTRIKNMWQQLGSDINVDAAAGADIVLSVSTSGKTLAISTMATRDLTLDNIVLVFEFDGNTKWEQLGKVISLKHLGTESFSMQTTRIPTKLALTRDGRRLAVSKTVDQGLIRIFDLDKNLWTIQGVINGNIHDWRGASIEFVDRHTLINVGVASIGYSSNMSEIQFKVVESVFKNKEVSDKWVQVDKELSNLVEVLNVTTDYQ